MYEYRFDSREKNAKGRFVYSLKSNTAGLMNIDGISETKMRQMIRENAISDCKLDKEGMYRVMDVYDAVKMLKNKLETADSNMLCVHCVRNYDNGSSFKVFTYNKNVATNYGCIEDITELVIRLTDYVTSCSNIKSWGSVVNVHGTGIDRSYFLLDYINKTLSRLQMPFRVSEYCVTLNEKNFLRDKNFDLSLR